MAKLLGHVRRKMLRTGVSPDDLDDDGTPTPAAPSGPSPWG
jgi:hypothetical protein